MDIGINDLSFRFAFSSEQQALAAVEEFVDICKELEKPKCTNVDRLLSVRIDTTCEVAPNCKLIQLIQKLSDRQKRTYLIGLLTNRATYSQLPEVPFIYKGEQSYACAWACNGRMLVSLLSEPGIAEPVLKGHIQEKSVEISNISQKNHMHVHRHALGLRRYVGNSRKHKKNRSNPYGKGRVGSPMDLEETEAQELLDHAVWIKGRLYARYAGRNYAFQNTEDNIYHGYIADDLGEDIVRALDNYKWKSGLLG